MRLACIHGMLPGYCQDMQGQVLQSDNALHLFVIPFMSLVQQKAVLWLMCLYMA